MTTPIVHFTPDFHRPNGGPAKGGVAAPAAGGAPLATARSMLSGKMTTATVGPPVITFSTTMNYALMYNDKGSGAHLDGAFYRPIASDGYFILGDYAQDNYNPPAMPSITITVENDDPTHPVLAPPTGYSLIWDDKGSGAHMDGSVWAPQPPPGYVALGAVSNNGYSPPSIPQLRCVRFDLVQAGTFGGLIWNDQGSGAGMDVEIYAITGLSTFYAQGNYNPPLGPVWIPKALR
jgi:hypothetical protein